MAAPVRYLPTVEAWRETTTRRRRRSAAVGWMTEARCQGLGPALFYPDSEEDAAEALEVCAGCPVRETCLEYALDAREELGVWGGATERERRTIQRRRQRTRSA